MKKKGTTRAETTETFTCCLSQTAGFSSWSIKQRDGLLFPSLHQCYQVNEPRNVLTLLDIVKQDPCLTELLSRQLSASSGCSVKGKALQMQGQSSQLGRKRIRWDVVPGLHFWYCSSLSVWDELGALAETSIVREGWWSATSALFLPSGGQGSVTRQGRSKWQTQRKNKLSTPTLRHESAPWALWKLFEIFGGLGSRECTSPQSVWCKHPVTSTGG